MSTQRLLLGDETTWGQACSTRAPLPRLSTKPAGRKCPAQWTDLDLTQQKRDFPDFYITSPQPCPYLPGRLERKVFTHLSREKPPPVIDHLLRSGFRRSQNIAYTPYCDACQACVSVRIVVDEFMPRRSLRRTLESNADLVVERLEAVPTEERYLLFRQYIESRHSDGGMAEMSELDFGLMVEDSIIETTLTEHRLNGRLVAAALCDALSDGISMVYSFYAPDHGPRSLGTYMILEQVEHARLLGLPYVYLGYWIRGSRKMSYKSRFRPLEHMTQSGWVRK